MKLVLGLGNPGRQYHNTRHNVGFVVVEALAARLGTRISMRAGGSLVGRALVDGVALMIGEPQTFMNNSGRAASALLGRYRIAVDDLLVVCDDFHLDLGTLRARRSGSSGGQKGLRSIMDVLGTRDFARLRVGIGPPKGDPVKFVLEKFKKNERPLVEEAVEAASRACVVWAGEGMDACMSAFN